MTIIKEARSPWLIPIGEAWSRKGLKLLIIGNIQRILEICIAREVRVSISTQNKSFKKLTNRQKEVKDLTFRTKCLHLRQSTRKDQSRDKDLDLDQKVHMIDTRNLKEITKFGKSNWDTVSIAD